MGTVGGIRVQGEMWRRSIVASPIPLGRRHVVVFVYCHSEGPGMFVYCPNSTRSKRRWLGAASLVLRSSSSSIKKFIVALNESHEE